MMPSQVSVTSRIPEIMAELDIRSKGLTLILAEETATAAAARAPVETGTLRDSIGAESTLKGAGVHLAWYWFFVEFGTRNMPAHPYLIPAFEAAASTLRARAVEALAEL